MIERPHPVCRIAPVLRALALCGLAAGCSAALDPVAITDAQAAARVKTVLVNDPDLGGRAIEVRVRHGVVTLSGRVRTPGEVGRAVDLARSVAGVSDVRSDLQVGLDAPAPGNGLSGRGSRFDDATELEANPSILAVGGAVGWSVPRAGALLTRFTISPIIKLGSGTGFGPTVGFDWFQADLRSLQAQPQTLSRVHVKPVMVGVSYTLTSGRVSVSPSVVGGIALNSLTVTDTGAAAGVPVEVDNSLAWRPGVSVWFDASRRMVLNVSAGYVMTRLRVTILENARLVKRDANGDTTTVHIGVAYRLF